MKKLLLASLVGAIIIFMWNAISWMVLPIHFDAFKYTPSQDSILNRLNSSGLESAAYMLPLADNRNLTPSDSKYQEERKSLDAHLKGKPVAMIFFNKSFEGDMASTFVMGFLYLFISVFCVSLILLAASSKVNTFGGRLWIVMLIALLFAFQGPMSDYNWMHFPWHYVRPMIIDIFVSWGLCGIWLSWYLGRE